MVPRARRAGILTVMPLMHAMVMASAVATQCVQPMSAGPVVPYAFAPLLGSGIYDLGGRTLQVYRLPLSYALREAAPGQLGWRLRAPVTVGFLDFKSRDVLQGSVPSNIDQLSLAPGIEMEYRPSERWSLRPYAEAGFILASASEIDARSANLGLRTDYRWPTARGEWLWATRLDYSRVDYSGCAMTDDLGRVRSGVDVPRLLAWRAGTRQMEIRPFALGEWFADRPHKALVGVGLPAFQAETGLMFGLKPMPKLWRFAAPRLGISYRFAGEISGWRLVIGEPL
jgi:hypothetical protein